ncbi:MAG: 16S rRNA (cytosine(967)-C(5))-methyltransferase RsmB, partial [Clostridia bacterium]|nr:16S rRNA (cytosine(967)-C(5))-methyltransferase RsmB [Clostridia bacterium]
LVRSGLSDSDRALCSALVYGVTERRITLDHRIASLSSRPTEQLDLAVRTALRLGLYQLSYMDRIPAHAAVNETVALVSKKASGFVNAILRSAQRTPVHTLPDEIDTANYLSVKYSVGKPLVEKLLPVFGKEEAEVLFTAFGSVPPTTLSVNTLKISREELATHIDGAAPTPFSPRGLAVRGSIRSLFGFEEGLFFVQDEASQIAVEALGAEQGETVMDICACPGSKSFGSAIRMKNEGTILAFDLHEKKLPLIASGATRLGIDIITPAVRDGRDPLPEWFGKADRVLCDVPCSGFGVLAKKPELRYKDPAASSALPDIQLAILENACRYVRAGGILLYSTCTILPEENEGNVTRFLERHPEFVLEPFSVGDLSVPSGSITLLPHIHHTDGFFVAKFKKQG